MRKTLARSRCVRAVAEGRMTDDRVRSSPVAGRPSVIPASHNSAQNCPRIEVCSRNSWISAGWPPGRRSVAPPAPAGARHGAALRAGGTWRRAGRAGALAWGHYTCPAGRTVIMGATENTSESRKNLQTVLLNKSHYFGVWGAVQHAWEARAHQPSDCRSVQDDLIIAPMLQHPIYDTGPK